MSDRSSTSPFRAAAAQFKPEKGDIATNIKQHVTLINRAAENQVNVVVFPEMSLMGYELELAADLAIEIDDPRLTLFKNLARQHDMLISVGAAIKNPTGKPFIGLFHFLPDGTHREYHKIHLTETEQIFCHPGQETCVIPFKGEKIGYAICADLGFPEQAAKTAAEGATLFLSSVLAADEWYEKDANRLSTHAQRHNFPTMMANYHGVSGPYLGNGQSGLWLENGDMILQAPREQDTLLIAEKTDKGWRGSLLCLPHNPDIDNAKA